MNIRLIRNVVNLRNLFFITVLTYACRLYL